MSNIEITEKQIQAYNVVKSHDGEPVSKKQIAKEQDVQVRQIAPTLRALIDAGILVLDEYGEYLLAAGIKEEEDGSLTIPTPQATPTTTPSISDQGRADEPVDESDDPNSEYYSLHPEELVTFYQEEGLDILKRRALQDALENTPGVGKKGLEAALHWFDIDEDMRRDPTALMRSLEDAGVPHKIVGRVAREAFLPEKKYARHLKPDTDIIIDRGRPGQGRRDIMINQQPYDGYGYPNQWQPGQGPGQQQPPLSHRNRFEPQGPPDMGGGQPPWWYNQLMTRFDNMDNTSGQGRRGKNSEPEDSRIVIEPVLDKHGQPVEDPNNPGNYLVRKIVYEGDSQAPVPVQGYPGQPGPEPEHVKLMREQLNEQKEELKQFRKAFEDQETERKIYGAITEATNPLIQKINSLERQPPILTGDMTDDRFKLVTEKEIFQDMTGSVKEVMTDVLEPVVQGVQEMQKMAGMREVIDMEKADGVPSGTYLKYMMGSNSSEESITKDRVSGTINRIKKTNK